MNLLNPQFQQALFLCQGQPTKTINLIQHYQRPLTAPKKHIRLPKQVANMKSETIHYVIKKTTRRKKVITENIKIKNESKSQDDFILEIKTPEQQKQLNMVTDGSEELVLRQKAIQKITKKKTVNEEIAELKKLEQQLLLTYQGKKEAQKQDEQIDNMLKERRQQIYKKIYENVKQISGVNKKEQQKKQRDQDILNFINQQTESNKHQPHIQQYLLQAKQQIEELRSFSQRTSSRQISSDSRRERVISPFVKIQDVFVRQDSSQERNSTPIRSLQRKHTRQQSQQSVPKRTIINSVQSKQIDQELLHILLTRWKDINKTKIRKSPRKILYKDDDSKKKRLKQISEFLLKWLQKMNRCKITLKMLSNHRFPTQPFSIDGSFVFLRAVKFENLKAILNLLKQNRYLLFEFNHVGQTCLHISAKSKNIKITKYLIENGADYEARDFMNRTPLYYAVQTENKEVFQLLIRYGAVPWGISSQSQWFNDMLKQIRKIHTIVSISPLSLRSYILDHELSKLF